MIGANRPAALPSWPTQRPTCSSGGGRRPIAFAALLSAAWQAQKRPQPHAGQRNASYERQGVELCTKDRRGRGGCRQSGGGDRRRRQRRQAAVAARLSARYSATAVESLTVRRARLGNVGCRRALARGSAQRKRTGGCVSRRKKRWAERKRRGTLNDSKVCETAAAGGRQPSRQRRPRCRCGTLS